MQSSFNLEKKKYNTSNPIYFPSCLSLRPSRCRGMCGDFSLCEKKN